MATWPAEFCPLINSFQEQPPENTIRSTMDKGPAKVRRRTTANVRPVSFNMFLMNSQMDLMDSFYVTETFSGADEFDFIHPRTKANVKARFTQPPSYGERSSVGYQVSISLEILP